MVYSIELVKVLFADFFCGTNTEAETVVSSPFVIIIKIS